MNIDPKAIASDYCALCSNLDILARHLKANFDIDPDKIIVGMEIPTSIPEATYTQWRNRPYKFAAQTPPEQPKYLMHLSLFGWAELQKSGIDFQYISTPDPTSFTSENEPYYSELSKCSINIRELVGIDSLIFRERLCKEVEKAVEKVMAKGE